MAILWYCKLLTSWKRFKYFTILVLRESVYENILEIPDACIIFTLHIAVYHVNSLWQSKRTIWSGLDNAEEFQNPCHQNFGAYRKDVGIRLISLIASSETEKWRSLGHSNGEPSLNFLLYWPLFMHLLASIGLSEPYGHFGPLLLFLTCVSHLMSLEFSQSLDDFTSFLFYIPSDMQHVQIQKP